MSAQRRFDYPRMLSVISAREKDAQSLALFSNAMLEIASGRLETRDLISPTSSAFPIVRNAIIVLGFVGQTCYFDNRVLGDVIDEAWVRATIPRARTMFPEMPAYAVIDWQAAAASGTGTVAMLLLGQTLSGEECAVFARHPLLTNDQAEQAFAAALHRTRAAGTGSN